MFYIIVELTANILGKTSSAEQLRIIWLPYYIPIL